MYSKSTSLAAVAAITPLISAFCETGTPFRDPSVGFAMNSSALPVSAGVVCTQDNVATSGVCANGTTPQCDILGSGGNMVTLTGLAIINGVPQDSDDNATFVEFLVGKLHASRQEISLSYTSKATLGGAMGTPTQCLPVGSNGNAEFIPELVCYNGTIVGCSSDVGVPERSNATVCGIPFNDTEANIMGSYGVNLTTAAEARNMSSNPASPANQNSASMMGWSFMVIAPLAAAALAQIMS